MTLAALKARIAAAAGGTLTLEAADFGLDAVTDLFARYVPEGTLTLSDCVPGPDGLSAAGALSLGAAAGKAAKVAILADEAAQQATGLSVTLPLASWKVDLPFAAVDASEIGSRGGTDPRLELTAGGEAGAAASARIAGDFPLPLTPPQTAVIAAAVQPAAVPPLNYQFEVQPAGAELDGFAALAALAAGWTFTPPADIPLDTKLRLTTVAYTIDPAAGDLVAICFDLRSEKGLPIVPGTVEIEWFEFQLFLIAPALPGPLLAAVMASVQVHGDTILLSAALPSLAFSGRLDHDSPIPLGPFLAKFGADDDFFAGLQLSAFEFAVGLAAPYAYSASLDIEEAAGATAIALNGESIQLQELTIEIHAEGSGAPDASFGSKILIGDVPLYLDATKDSGRWQFAGGTAEGPPIDFGGWIDSVAATYNFTGLPSSVKALSLDRIGLLYDSGDSGGTFVFDCSGELKISDATVDAAIKVTLSNEGGKSLDGTLSIATPSRQFDFTLDVKVEEKPAPKTTLIGTLAAPGAPIGLVELLNALGFEPDLPDGIDIKLHDLAIAYQTRDDQDGKPASTFILTADASEFGEAMLVIDRTDAGSTYLFAAAPKVTGSLADIPIVGGAIPPDLGLTLEGLQLLLASKPIAPAEMKAIAALVQAIPLPGGRAIDLPAAGLEETASLTVAYKAGSDAVQTLVLGAGGQAPASAPPSPAAPATPAPAPAPAPPPPAAGKDGMIWLSLQKQLGQLHFNRIGFGYAHAELKVALDVGAALGPLSLSLDGLALSTPLTRFWPGFDLSGIGLGYAQPPLAISGALLKLSADRLTPTAKFQFDGSVLLSLEDVTIAGIGSYAQLVSGDPSLFVFAELLTPLGGPPAFFVTGLMAGFGFNRSLTIPAVNQVSSFPLLALVKPSADGSPTAPNDAGAVLTQLEAGPAPWIAPQPGALWFAAGVQFTSFELVTTNALLIVEPVGDVTVALLGISDMTLPLPADNAKTYCFVELQLDAVFKPNDGVLAASALLSNNSYVLTPDCHLTGGFAFSAWFGSNEHAGDFVLTLGGYHPAFAVPSHYPIVPRLAFNWSVSDCVSVHGDAYFALTPSCAMGGGGLEVLFHDGDLQAWFTANADFLISWRPFWFTGDIDVSIGASYRLNLGFCHTTLSLSMGAGVTIWGPPTGGRVHVHFVVVTFTVSFGSDSARSRDSALLWSEVKALLPQPKAICTVTAGNKLAGTDTRSASPAGGAASAAANAAGAAGGTTPAPTNPPRWIVRPRGFAFSSASAIPASRLAWEGPAKVQKVTASGASISIRPMFLDGVASVHSLKISLDAAGNDGIDLTAWTLSPRTQNVPASLWGKAPDGQTQTPGAPSADLVAGQFVGYDVTTPPTSIDGEVGAIAYRELAGEDIPDGVSPLATAVAFDASYLPAASTRTIAEIAAIHTGDAFDKRKDLFAALQPVAAPGSLTNGALDRMALNAAHLFADEPMEQAQ